MRASGRWVGLALLAVGCSQSKPLGLPPDRGGSPVRVEDDPQVAPAQTTPRTGRLGDRDGDRVADRRDACPDDPEDLDGFEDEDGCPEADNDGDGLRDQDDKCPNDAEDPDRFEDEDGCPDLDNDRDRILDAYDKCPNEPENYNGEQDEDGCPC